MTNDGKATVIGAVLAALQATQIDYHKLITGDINELAKALSAGTVAVLGFYINKKE